jgi:hypothetical protein
MVLARKCGVLEQVPDLNPLVRPPEKIIFGRAILSFPAASL